MGFKNFHFRIIIRTTLLVASMSLVSYCLVQGLYLRSAYAMILVAIQVAELLYFIFRFTRNLTNFLQSIKQRDFTIRFTENPNDKIFSALYPSLNSITDLFKKISVEKELKHRYLETLVSHVSFGVISVDENGNVMLVNQAFLELATTPHLSTLTQLQRKNSVLFEAVQTIQSGKKKLVQLPVHNQLVTLTLNASEFKLDEQTYKLISAQNITTELSKTEIDAWQRLIKVLTHEIMNSISPIISLSDSLHEISKNQSPENWQTINSGLEAIKLRSEGLLNFTQRYRKLTQIPAPEFQTINLREFIEHNVRLFKPELDQRKIQLTTNLQSVNASIDPVLMEQVFFNLIRNAIDAVEEATTRNISIDLSANDNRIRLVVSDSGTGIESQNIDRIFMPFFSTKKEGSGIGLALARQIVLLHGGQITVQSEVGKGTSFIIVI